MKRDLGALAARQFDVAIIGGGSFGAAAAWDAALRGLSVALIERADFASGASAECFKMVHGGIRYLQHADISRLRKSCAERSAFLRIAPHLVNPLPILIPTYGRGKQSKAFLRAGMAVYDALSAGRNSGIEDPQRHIPNAQFFDRASTLNLFPELEGGGLTGSAVFCDGQMYSPARLVLAFVRSAVQAGAVAANYVEAREFLWDADRVCGVRATDLLANEQLDIRAHLVLNAAGPGAEYLLSASARFGQWQRGHFSRDAYFIVNRKPRSEYALAVPGQSHDRDALVSRTARHLFVVPWRDYTLIGVWHRLFSQHPDAAVVNESELDAWLREINTSLPTLALRRDEIITTNCGLVPFGDGTVSENELSFGKESRVIDHRKLHGIAGLVTLIGIRYTTARADAALALNVLLSQRPSPPPPAATASTPLFGGDIANFAAFRDHARRTRGANLSSRSLDSLLRNHGSRYGEVLDVCEAGADRTVFRTLADSSTLEAEVVYAARAEMAVTLEDVIMRRTDLGSGCDPGQEALHMASLILQKELGWNDQRRRSEVDAAAQTLLRHHAAKALPAAKRDLPAAVTAPAPAPLAGAAHE